MKIKKIVSAAVVIMATTVCLLTAVNAQTKVEAVVFLYDSCGGCSSNGMPCKACKTEEEFYQKYQNILKENNLTGRVNLTVYNTFFEKNRDLYERYKKEYKIKSTIQPIMFIGNTVLTGSEEIRTFFLPQVEQDRPYLSRSQYPVLKSSEITFREERIDKMVYFYMVQCPDCVEMQEYFDLVKDRIEDFDHLFLKYDVLAGENKELMKIYWQEYGMSEGLEVPALFVNGKCLVNVDEIKEYMETNLVEKEYTIETKVFIQEK